jgi:hypothetical protein
MRPTEYEIGAREGAGIDAAMFSWTGLFAVMMVEGGGDCADDDVPQ